MPVPTPDFLQGTLDMLILRTVADEARHGYAIARAIEAASAGELAIGEGSLYPALHRLERRGDLASKWVTTDENRSAKVYRLTPRGRKRLAEQTTLWNRLSGAVSRVLAAPGGASGGTA